MLFLINKIPQLFWGGVLLLLVGCTRSGQLNPEAPSTAVATPVVYAPKLSTITVPVSFRISTLEEKLNRELSQILYTDDNLKDDNLAIKVNKAGLLKIQADNNKIYLTLPLHILAVGRWQWAPCKVCPKLQKTESTEFDLEVKSESELSFTEDYQVKSVSTSNFSWGNTKPVLTLGPLKIGLARFIEPALRRQMQTLSGQLDREIQNRIQIKNYVQQAWLQVQKPIPLNKELDAWLTVMPQAIRVSPITARNGELTMQLGFSSYLQTVTNGQPTVAPNPTLPRLLTDNNLINNVQIGLTSDISYTHATNLLKQQLNKQQFSFSNGKDQITVHDVALSGSGTKLVIMLDVTGTTQAGFFKKSIAGKIFIKAIPYYDVATASIRVRDADYDLNTKDQLLKTASWLAKNRFIQTIEDQISFPIKTQLEQARQLLQRNLDEATKVNTAVQLKGNITEIIPDAIYLTPTSIKAVVNAKGNLTAQINSF